MCRFVVYLGPEVIISSVVTEPEHGLIQQSKNATDPNSVAVNADGFGIAWYAPDVSPIPAIYKEATPAWNNQNLQQIARVVKSPCILAHVRAASAGVVVQTNCHPFTFRSMSFMHNGTVPYFSNIKKRIIHRISDSAFELIQGTTDSEMMFALFITHFERFASIREEGEEFKEVPYNRDKYSVRNMMDALKATIHMIHKLSVEYEMESENKNTGNGSHGNGHHLEADGAEPLHLPPTKVVGRLNLALTDGHTSIVTRYVCTEPENAHSLYYSRGTRVECKEHHFQVLKNSMNMNPMLLVSSEPLDTCYECEMVPANHMVVASQDGYFCIESCL